MYSHFDLDLYHVNTTTAFLVLADNKIAEADRYHNLMMSTRTRAVVVVVVIDGTDKYSHRTFTMSGSGLKVAYCRYYMHGP